MSQNFNMSEAPDVKVSPSDTYKEINVSGQVTGLNYDGMKLTVFHDSPNLTQTLTAEGFKPHKVVIDRYIECTLNMPPQTIKEWALILSENLARYEKTFGMILSPEEVEQKFREYNEANG